MTRKFKCVLVMSALQPCGRRRRTWSSHPSGDSQLCPTFCENAARRLVKPRRGQVRVRWSNDYHTHMLIHFRSEQTAAHRWDKDAPRHRERVSRRLSTSQIVFGRYRCADQALRSPFLSNRAAISLTRTSQECKDVEDKLRELLPWLAKLKESVTTARADDSYRAEGRETLTRFASHIYDVPD